MHHNRRSPVPIKTLARLCIATMIVGLALSLEPTRPGHAATFTPKLAPLDAHGGPTFTHALRPASPAIDAGNPATPGGGGSNTCEATDQRGLARTVDGNGDDVARCDIGAYELTDTLVVDRTDDFAPASFCTAIANDCSLRGAIQAANGNPADDIILLPPGVYTLTIPGDDENLALTGDLDINSSLALTSAGAVTINGNSLVTGDRVFHVTGDYTVTFSNVTIRGGNGTGGGLYNYFGRLTLINTTLVSNTSIGGGGGIYNSGSLTIINSTLNGNTATSAAGGGIFNNGSLTIINSTLSGNTATAGAGGGGIYNSGSLTITNSTLSGNTATTGGGLYAYAAAVTLNNVTVVSNTVTSGDGGGIQRFAGAVTLLNTLLAGNTDLGGQAPDCSGLLTSLGHNLIGNLTGCAFASTTGDQVGAGANPLDPGLGPLQDNGGFTPTHALQLGGPAIDAGDNATCAVTDQRGVTRPFGPACDIGAFELDVYALYLPLVRR